MRGTGATPRSSSGDRLRNTARPHETSRILAKGLRSCFYWIFLPRCPILCADIEGGIDLNWQTSTRLLDDLSDFSNDAAWRRLMRGLHRPVYDFARSMGLSSTDADDTAQESLTAFAIQYGSYCRRKGRLNRWLFGIAFRQVLRHRRLMARRKESLLASAQWRSVLQERRAAAALWERIWEVPVIQRYIGVARSEFTPPTYVAFHRVTFDRCQAGDVASELGMSVQAVYAAKHRVMRRLRQLAIADSLDG